jgi:nucleoid DNA-binding protein
MVLTKYLKNIILKEIKKFGSVFAITQLQYSFNYLFTGGIMTRVQLVEKLAYRMKVTKKEADAYLIAFLDSIIDTLAKEGRVVLQGFGSFKINEYKAREAKKPLTGEAFHLPFRRKPSFHAGKELRERINEKMELMHETEDLITRLHVPEKAFEATMG